MANRPTHCASSNSVRRFGPIWTQPDGAATSIGNNGEDISVKFDQAGIYGAKCLPHYDMGMVALVVVDAPANLDQAKAIPQVGKAKQVFAALFEKLETSKTASN
jgi:hypothetical protein